MERSVYLDVFSMNTWTHLSQHEKNKHTLQQCFTCQTQHSSLTNAFPAKPPKRRMSVIEFSAQDMASPSDLGKKALKELNIICVENFDMSAQEVLAETPRSKLIKKPSNKEVLAEKRRSVRLAKKSIQQSMDNNSLNTVMSNRLSWRKFDIMRKSETLKSDVRPSSSAQQRKRTHSPSDENTPPSKRSRNSETLECNNPNYTPTRKRNHPSSDEHTPPSKKKHGSPSALSKTVEEDLLQEAQNWSDDQEVNWSELARRHGITKANGGQTVKEFLKLHNIPAASGKQRKDREPRRKRKTLPGGIPNG